MGDKDSVLGFAALGIETFSVCEPVQAAERLRKMASSDYAIIYITEALAAEISEEIARYTDRVTPAIILIPGIVGNTGAGMDNVKKTVEKAVGSDIIS